MITSNVLVSTRTVVSATGVDGALLLLLATGFATGFGASATELGAEVATGLGAG